MTDASLAETVQVTVAKVAVKQDAMKEQNDRMEREIGTIAQELREFTKTFSDNYVLKEIYKRDRQDDEAKYRRLLRWAAGLTASVLLLIVGAALSYAAQK